MHYTYICSSASLRSKGSFPFSGNDYYPNFFNDIYEKSPHPLSSPPSCGACAFPIRGVSVNPGFVYGLRQSTLVQFSASKKLILPGGNRYFCRSPVYGIVQHCCCDLSCTVRDRVVSERGGRRAKGRLCREVTQAKGRSSRSGAAGDAEAMLSLLTEELGDNGYGVRGRSRSSFRRSKVSDRVNVVAERLSRGGKKGDLLESNSPNKFEPLKIESSGRENGRRDDNREDFSSGENRRVRKGSSSCSSYYSFPSSGDFEIDSEAPQKHEICAEVSQRCGAEDSGRISEAAVFDGEGREEGTACRKGSSEREEVMEQVKSGVRSEAAGSSIRWDWRKKSEKKLGDAVTDETHSSVLGAHKTSSAEASHYDKSDRMDESYVDENGRKQYRQIGIQASGKSETSGGEYKRCADSRPTSRRQEELISMEDNLAISPNLSQETRDEVGRAGFISHQPDSRRNSERLISASEICRRTSNSNRLSETSDMIKGGNATSISSSIKETQDQQHQTCQVIARDVDSSKEFQHSTEILDLHHSDIERTSASQRLSDSIAKNKEENVRQLNAGKMDSRKEFQHSTIGFERSEVERISASQRQFESDDKAVMGIKSKAESTSASNVHVTDVKTSTKSSETSESKISRESYFTSVDETADQIDGSVNKEVERSSQTIVTPPPSQLFRRASLPVQSTGAFLTQEDSSKIAVSGSSGFFAHPHEINKHLQPDLYDGSSREELDDDVLGSAYRMEKSSMQIFGELIENIQSEVSASEVLEKEKIGQPKVVYEGQRHNKFNLSDSSGEGFKKAEPNSRRSTMTEPSDGMGDILDSTVEESVKTEASEEAATDRNKAVKRSSRSFWSIVADIVHFRWASHADPRNSAVKRGGRTSSSESSEAWHSGHEPDAINDENVRKRRKARDTASPKQMQPAESPNQSKRLGSDASSSKEKLRQLEADKPSSSSFLEGRSASDCISLASGSENINLSEDGTRHASPSPAVLESSLLLPTRSIRSTGNDDVSGRDSIEHTGKPLSTKPNELLGTAKDGELKRRKLQRKSQLLKDSFDEWEEAYKRESEQQKIDEFFMKEALLEAKKAADAWEVPVGAVLVQHGKVIARGFNLMEELRDSTAHAEMICIREASNMLKSWRLVDATLYVTLEPCPMCAGAILQARIDTLVWGAPNKLLGADGSWIRLFPGGGGGADGSEEISNKPAPPVHPFHPKMAIRRGVLASECADAMQQFFQLRRRAKQKDTAAPTSSLAVSRHPSKFMSKLHNIFHIMFCL